jgi:hypothetical protein
VYSFGRPISSEGRTSGGRPPALGPWGFSEDVRPLKPKEGLNGAPGTLVVAYGTLSPEEIGRGSELVAGWGRRRGRGFYLWGFGSGSNSYAAWVLLRRGVLFG